MLTGGTSVDVSERQKKLSRWAEEDKSRSFEDLFNLLYDEDGYEPPNHTFDRMRGVEPQDAMA
jgi:hypothetical protein